MLQIHRDEVLGRSQEQFLRAISPNRHQAGNLATRWRNRVVASGTQDRHVDTVLALLSHLFPVVRAEVNDKSWDSRDIDALGNRRGVAHPDYFDNYFSYGVPTEGLPDRVVSEAVRDLARGAATAAVDRLTAELLHQTGRVTWKLKRKVFAGSGAIVPLLRLLADVYPRLDDGSGTWSAGQTIEVNLLTYHLLLQLPAEDVLAFIRERCRTPSGLDQISEVVRLALANADDGVIGANRSGPSWAEEANRKVTAAFAVHHEQLQTMQLVEFAPGHRGRWWTWRQMDQRSADRWLQAQVDQQRWDLLAVLKSWITMSRVTGVTDAPWRLSELQNSIIEAVGADRVLRDLAEWLQQVPSTSGAGLDHLEDTDANRELVVAHALRQWSRQTGPGNPDAD